MKTALITGVTGQDGAYLSRLLLTKGYVVHGLRRRASAFNTARIDDLVDHPGFRLHYGDMTDGTSLRHVVGLVQPDEVYNLAAQSHVHASFEIPEYTADADALGTLRLLEAVLAVAPKARVYVASTSELFGSSPPPQSETTPFRPRSPYAVAKLYAHWIAVNYREAYGLWVACGILFNHESPLRGETFVSRKVTRGLARVRLGLQDRIVLGNLDAQRDWGHAADYVRAMWLALQANSPDDYVVATGETRTVRALAETVAARLGLTLRWTPDDEGMVVEDRDGKLEGRTVVTVDSKYRRPTEVDALQGDATKARSVLGWAPALGFTEMINEMVDHDLRLTLAQRESLQ